MRQAIGFVLFLFAAGFAWAASKFAKSHTNPWKGEDFEGRGG